MNNDQVNTNYSASAHGSAAKTSMDNNPLKGSPRTPIPGSQEPIRNPGETVNPKATPIYNEDPRIFYQKFGSPMFVNPAMFANPFQQAEFMYQQIPHWAMPNMLGHQQLPQHFTGGRIPSASSETVNESVNNNQFTQQEITPTATLNRINDQSEFSTWIKNFIIFLRERKLEHVIPPENGQSTNSATDEEKKFITDVFKYFVSPKAYPAWFSKQSQERFIELYDVIENALYKETGYDNERSIAKELNSIYYDGKTDPFFFQKKLNNLRKKGLEIGVTTTDTILCERIVDHLSGPFKPIADNYDRNYTNISLTDLLDEIQRVYNRQIRDKTSTNKSNSNSTDYKPTTKSTLEKQVINKSTQKAASKGRNKKLFHIQDVDSSIEDLRQFRK